MWSNLSEPETDPVSLEEAKSWLRVSGSYDDGDIAQVLAAARESVEEAACVITTARRIRVALPGFPLRSLIELPACPVLSVESLHYYAPDGTDTLAPATDYTLIADEFRPVVWRRGVWPEVEDRPDAVRLIVRAGYESPGAVPPMLKQAILLTLGHWYENRSNVVIGTIAFNLPESAESICRRLKRYTL